jgi:hypothetical protein
MARMIDSLDYLADNVDLAPVEDWRIMRVTIAKVNKRLPRYCKPNCDKYQKDSDKNCLLVHECNSYVFDTHLVERGDKLCDVLFATNTLDPHEGWCWMVSEHYLKTLLGNKKVKKMMKEYSQFVEESEKQGFTIQLDEGDQDATT